MPLDSPSVVMLLDDSSSDDDERDIFPAAAAASVAAAAATKKAALFASGTNTTRQCGAITKDCRRLERIKQPSVASDLSKAKQKKTNPQQQDRRNRKVSNSKIKTAVNRPALSSDDDDDDDTEDLEVMPRAMKRHKTKSIPDDERPASSFTPNLEPACRPRLSSTGSSHKDPLVLYGGDDGSSDGSAAIPSLAERLAQRAAASPKLQDVNDMTKGVLGRSQMIVPLVSMSVASSSSQSTSSQVDQREAKEIATGLTDPTEKSNKAASSIQEQTSSMMIKGKDDCGNHSICIVKASGPSKIVATKMSDARAGERTRSTRKPTASKLQDIKQSLSDEDDNVSKSRTMLQQSSRATDTAILRRKPATSSRAKDGKTATTESLLQQSLTSDSSSEDEGFRSLTSSKINNNRKPKADAQKENRGPRNEKIEQKNDSMSTKSTSLPRLTDKSSKTKLLLSYDSSSLSDEEIECPRRIRSSKAKPLAASKKKNSPNGAKEQKDAEKEAKRKQRDEERDAKQREKELVKEQRERERQEKKEAVEQAKQQRKDAREEAGQARGKFASQEVAVLMEPALVNHEVFDVKGIFEEQGYQLHSYPSALSCLAVQWVRRDYLLGGASEALKMVHARKDDEFELFNTLVVLFDCPHDFISLIQQVDGDKVVANEAIGTYGEDDDDYPKLESWLLGLVAGWRAAWRKTCADRPRIYLILYQVQKALDKAWVNYNRSRGGENRGPPPPNAEQLHDAILWMLIQFQIEVIHCESKDDVPKELAKITRFLANARYQAQTTELACIQKIKAQVSDMAPSHERAVDCWIRQLQQVPRVSAEMARCFARFYPTARSLWLAYQDPDLTLEEKHVLVANCFGTRASQLKVSHWMYRIFSSQNPNELLT
ncbi:hypothetical protein ACA910_015821 [Epithemia clementina (nom. ined.)]